MRAQTKKPTFSCKDNCTLTTRTRRWTYSALRYIFFYLFHFHLYSIKDKKWPVRQIEEHKEEKYCWFGSFVKRLGRALKEKNQPSWNNFLFLLCAPFVSEKLHRQTQRYKEQQWEYRTTSTHPAEIHRTPCKHALVQFFWITLYLLWHLLSYRAEHGGHCEQGSHTHGYPATGWRGLCWYQGPENWIICYQPSYKISMKKLIKMTIRRQLIMCETLLNRLWPRDV